jgi:exosortase
VRVRSLLLPACLLGFLWFTLINHLRIEWSVNPQYNYGWAVPFLCAFLIWKKISQVARDTQPPEVSAPSPVVSNQKAAEHASRVTPHASGILIIILALVWFPTRLIQEANPEWRFISWALALEVIGLTLLIVIRPWSVVSSQSSRITDHASRINLTFPLCFFLVAVPWPTAFEGPLVQLLTRVNATATVEVSGWFGLPALQRGNVIEIGTGIVGIDDACSGIRSFQATLMIALFLGELYRLAVRRRLLLMFGGFVLAFAFNVARTSLLVWIASRKGMAAMSAWHDSTGVAILVVDFICLWLAAWAMRPRTGQADEKAITHHASGISHRASPWLYALAAWLALAEIGTETWYRSHEVRVPKTTAWNVEFPRDNPTFRALPFSDRTKQFLRYDEGVNGAWIEEGDLKLQAIFLRWKPGRITPHLAKSHTPEVCLTAAGHKLLSQSDLRLISVHGLRLPFRSYVVQGESVPIHVFYCLWEDRADEQGFGTTSLTYANRLKPVLAGRRNSGQRSLEIALWGMADAAEAETALARELAKLIHVAK